MALSIMLGTDIKIYLGIIFLQHPMCFLSRLTMGKLYKNFLLYIQFMSIAAVVGIPSVASFLFFSVLCTIDPDPNFERCLLVVTLLQGNDQ